MSRQSQPTPPPTTSEATPNCRSLQPDRAEPAQDDPHVTAQQTSCTRERASWREPAFPVRPRAGFSRHQDQRPVLRSRRVCRRRRGRPATGTTTASMLDRWPTGTASTVRSTQWAETDDDPCPERGRDCPSAAPAPVSIPPLLLARAETRRPPAACTQPTTPSPPLRPRPTVAASGCARRIGAEPGPP